MSVVLSVDKSGDLKINKRKCRLYKKDEVVKVAKKLGVNTNKKTTAELCTSMKSFMNNIPLAKMYPQAKPKAKPKATALNKKVAANFMKGMVTTNKNIAKLKQLNMKPKPSKKAAPLTISQATNRIMAMKTLPLSVRKGLVYHMQINKNMSPRRHVKMARIRAQLA